MPLSYIITAKWGKDLADWYIPLELTIRNNTDQDVNSPEISFDVNKIHNITPGSEIRAYTGFAQQTFTPPVIKEKLSEHLSLLKAKSSTTLTFGVSFSSTSTYPSLPTDFTFSGEPIVIPEDHTPPTPVKNITTTSSGPTSFSLNWTPSIDKDTGVDKYIVKYRVTNETKYHEASTITNSISLKNLTTNTNYEIYITVFDYANNTSVPSLYYASTGEALKGPAAWQEGNHIKGSPFVDATAWPTPPIDKWAESTNLKGYFLGFITAATDKNTGEVKACWGGNLSMSDGNDNQQYEGDVIVSDYYKSYISGIREKNGDIILSFGGASNEPIEGPITDIKQIVDIYLKAIKNYDLTAIDFDFEGGFLAHNEALDRHIVAITEVIKAHPELKVSYTLPVDGAPGLMGFNANGVIFLNKLYEAGITPSLVNCMSMEFGQGSSSNLFECARLSLEGDAANDTDGNRKGAIKQLKEIWTNLSTEQIYKMTGLMYAKHLNGKVNTVEDQAEINKYFIGAKGLGNVSGWDASLDMDPAKGGGGYSVGDYSKVVAQYEPDLLGSHSLDWVPSS
ncbi:fibronectin type III domain-containing protein [Rickettsia endosymbiont of Seladonia tumulorum]|uniref:fibronectin type III domain-containing protein n=1 Tax=Rickettsia endosymbiont of Seladonia tumulorum TaxID=3066270 RepID=UPI00313E125D